MDDDGVCRVCGDYINDQLHNGTVNHRFHFFKWAYNEYRKALISDRHGVTLSVEAERINNFHFDFQDIKGKYKTKVSPEQLRLHNNTITFKCKIKNNRKDAIYITNTNLLHPSDYFDITHSNNFGGDETTFVKLLQGGRCVFRVVFKTDVLQCASYKIPLSCCFQTVDNQESFTIIRTFVSNEQGSIHLRDSSVSDVSSPQKLREGGKQPPFRSYAPAAVGLSRPWIPHISRTLLLIIDDQIEKKEEKGKSPFTSQPWKDVEKIIPTSKTTKFTDKYPIPPEYKKILIYGLQRFGGMTLENENNFMKLTRLLQKLTKYNYNEYWHIVLWLEETAQALMLTKYNMEGVKVLMQPHGIVEIEVPGLAEKRPSVIAGDFIKIRISGDHTAYRGFVDKVKDSTVEISHLDEEILEILERNPSYEVDVSFVIGRLAFERMHRAVDTLVATGMVERLFPPNRVPVRSTTIYQLQNSDFVNQSIIHNDEQKKAVDRILNSVVDLPYIVFGPPGTGKSITILEAIVQIKKRTKKTILVCAPANSACDMLALKLIPFCTKSELIRIHSTTRDRTTITDELVAYSNMIEDEFTRVDIQQLKSYRIVVTTLVLIGRFATCGYNPDCVFVDEAAQASEPETDIAISLGKQIVLAGDPKQLGPMATKCAAKYGLEKSLLERLMEYKVYQPRNGNYDSNFITMLKLNFRSHPDILLIPNELFYDNLLVPRSIFPLRDPIVDIAIYPLLKKKTARVEGRAIEFCSVSAKDRREGSSPSYFNLFEAKMVAKYVQALVNLNVAEAYKVRVDQIGVVTPYKRQVHKIKATLRYSGFPGVEVGTTESFQGREKRIIILSSVRAQHSQLLLDRKYNLGFVKNDRRFNVALTRAISKLIIVGCPLVLRTDDKWGRYMDLCEDYGTYFGNLFARDNEEFRQNVLERSKRFKHKDDQYNNNNN